MRALEVSPGDPDRAVLRAFLAEHAHPIDDLLAHADVDLPLARLATAWVLEEGGEAVAVAFSFPLWPSTPALGVKGRTPADERSALAKLVALGAFTQGYVICAEAQRRLWEEAGRADAGHREAQMLLPAADWSAPESEGVRLATLAEVDAFYRERGAAAWNPIQFETGPYVLAHAGGVPVAAAGTHFAYPALAQVGNVLTAPEQRGKGLARACTAAVVDALFARGHAHASLFVDVENAPALRVYERLGFRTHRVLRAFSWRA